MKIVIATAVYYPQIDGVAVFSRNLAEGLARRGHEVLVLTPSQSGRNHTKNSGGVKIVYLKSAEIKIYPDQIHDVPKKRRLFYRHGFRVAVFPMREVNTILNEFCPDVVHVQVSELIGISVVRYARQHDIPVVTTEHNQPEVITEPMKVPGFAKKPVNMVLSKYFLSRQNKSDFVTMPTKQAIRNLLASGGELDVPVAAVSNGVDLKSFKPGKVSNEIREKYGIPKKSKIALYVGRVDPEKSVDRVVQAFSGVCGDFPEAKLVIVGDGIDKSRLIKLVNEEGLSDRVLFLGRVLPPDLYELYRIGDVFMTASEIETQGIVLVEAAATGLPLIAVNRGAVNEICIDGRNGFLCEPDDLGGMQEGLRKILSDDSLRKRMSEESIKIASEHDFEHTLDRFVNIYKHVILKKIKR